MKTYDEYVQEIMDNLDKQLESVEVLFRIKSELENAGFNFTFFIGSDYDKLWCDIKVDSFYDALPFLEAIDGIIGTDDIYSYDDDDATYRAYSFTKVVVCAYPRQNSQCQVVEVHATKRIFKCA